MEIRIYQEINPKFRVDEDVKFVDKKEYKKVFERKEVVNCRSDYQILEDLFLEFNRGNYPEEYQGHSMSVGDIVELENKVFICASCGWGRVDWRES